MIFVGIDAGIENTKVVVMKDREVIGRTMVSTGGFDRLEQVQKAYDLALATARASKKDVKSVVSTGKGKFDISFADARITEAIATAHAVRFLVPEATSFMSVGADETIAATLGDTRLIQEYVINQKCSAGLGTFLTYLARRLEQKLEDIDAAESDAGRINEGCIVFSELDSLSLVNNGASPVSVMSSAIKAVAVRAANIMNDLTIPSNKFPVLIGGLTKSAAFVNALETALGLKFHIPDNAEYAGAIGAVISRGKVTIDAAKL